MNLRRSETSKMVFFHRNPEWVTDWTQTITAMNEPTLEIVPLQDVDWIDWVKESECVGFADYTESSVGHYLLCEGNPEGITTFGRQILGEWDGCEDFNDISGRIFRTFRTILWVSEKDGAKNRNEMAKLLEKGAVDVWNPPMEGDEMCHRLVATLHREQMLLRLKRAATVDFLTGLPTRRAFEMAVTHAIAAAIRMRTPCCVAMVDLDQFKHINDRYQHAVGDVLLREFAGRLRRYSRKSDFYARWGGDEFVYFLPNTDEDDAHRWAERMRKEWTRPVVFDGWEIPLSVSLGIAPLPRWDAKPPSSNVSTFLATPTVDCEKVSPQAEMDQRIDSFYRDEIVAQDNIGGLSVIEDFEKMGEIVQNSGCHSAPERLLEQMLRGADTAMYREKSEKMSDPRKWGLQPPQSLL